MRHTYSLPDLCKAYKVSSSSYYSYMNGDSHSVSQKNEKLRVHIRAAHTQTRETYGAARLHEKLADDGVTVSLWKVKQLRREMNITCKQRKKFKSTTNSKHSLPVAENILGRQFTRSACNEAWVSDITYIWTLEGWLYLAGVKDLYNKEIVGYCMSDRMTKDIVIRALNAAILKNKPEPGLILHSDQGSQYCSNEYRKISNSYGMQLSMSRKGNCWDNAPMESFWGLLKNELVHHTLFATRAEARKAITEYIELFYNRQRIQAELGFLSPATFAVRQRQILACAA